MRAFGLPPLCELEICSSDVVHTAKMVEARGCELRYVFCGFNLIVLLRFVKEITFSLYQENKRILTDWQQQV